MTKAQAVRLARACQREGLETAIASWGRRGRWSVYISDPQTGFDLRFESFDDALALFEDWRRDSPSGSGYIPYVDTEWTVVIRGADTPELEP